ncbi:MAG TPA: tetratricopeptide repeat protein [Myxococcota bacterium]|nr:tetratricopeptide repeat protein [Myxococcota bacterium]
MTESWRRVGFALLLAGAAVWLYAPVREFPFLHFDDGQYVTGNPQVLRGLDAEGVRWAFTTFLASNWHPLTWLSHMADVSAFGSGPAAPHLENALLHGLCSALVFLALARLTGQAARSAAAALLFAVHPQHVESVAWVSERKDLLCAAFGLIALVVWPDWARGGRRWAYGVALAAQAAGLLAKPMLVSLPLLLLVLDAWPLRRAWSTRLLLEKLPFAALSLASSVMTLVAQGTAMQLEVDLPNRLDNALVALALTLGQSLVPVGLAVMYPHPVYWPLLQVLAAAALLAGLAAAAFALRRRAPYLAAGALWFAIGLGPTLGLVQVGFQARADRYAYLPQIGVAWAVVWGAADVLARVPAARALGPTLTVLAAAALAFGTRAQLQFWRSDSALWERALAVTGPNYYAETEYAMGLAAVGRIDESLPHFARAVELNPRWPRAQAHYAFALYYTGDPAGAAQHLERAFALTPEPGAASMWHVFYARALAQTGRFDAAAEHYEKQLALEPDTADALLGLAELRATAPSPPLRNGAEAQRLVTRACQLVSCEHPQQMDVRALALAASGDVAGATALEELALAQARQLGWDDGIPQLDSHLAVFRSGNAVVQRPPPQ